MTSYSDPNINISWAFCELTYNDAQLFANISYVDCQHADLLDFNEHFGRYSICCGIPSDGLATVCNGLRKQAAVDHPPRDQLICSHNGRPLRTLSPNNLLVGNQNASSSY